MALDSDLLDVLEDRSKKTPRDTKTPGTFVFGRTKTPELKTSRSQSNFSIIAFDSSKKVEKSNLSPRPILGVVAQSANMNDMLKDATKKMSKQNQATDFVSRNKAALASIPNKPQDRVESQKPKNKQYESVTPKYLERKPSVKPEEKENNPGASSRVVKPKPQPTKSNHIQIENVQNQRQSSINRSNKRSENVDAYISAGGQSQKGSLSQRRRTDQGSYSSKNNLGNPRSKSPMEKKVHVASPIVEEPVKKDSPKVSMSREVTKSNISKARDKSKKKEQYKPETMDLFSRLNEYSKFKENCDKLCQPELDDSLMGPRPVPNKNQSKDKAKAEEFLKKQITDFKENSPRKKRSAVQSSIDLQRVSQPRFKKQAVQIANECSFQPMLSKKSLAIVQKNGYSKDNLYQSRTPKKNEDDADESDAYRPKLCQKSMHIDQAKRRLEMPRFEVLGRMVNLLLLRVKSILTERKDRLR